MSDKSEKYFSIMVLGAVPSEVEEGFLNKTTGMPDGKTEKMVLTVGAIHIPNFSRAWAYQEMKNSLPTGTLVFHKWGEKHDAGKKDEKQCRPVEIRYLRGCNSLDKQYQDSVLKMRVSEEDSQLSLVNGINDFDMVTEEPLIEMLKHHTFNKDNKSRDPHNRDILFSEYNPINLNLTQKTEMHRRNKAERIVLDAEGSEERLVVLANLFDLDPKAQDEVIFNDLLKEVANFDSFLRTIDITKARFKFMLEQLQTNRVLEFTQEGDAVLIIDDAKEFLYKGINVGDKIQFLSEGVLEPEIYEAYLKVEQINDKLMEVLN